MLYICFAFLAIVCARLDFSLALWCAFVVLFRFFATEIHFGPNLLNCSRARPESAISKSIFRSRSRSATGSTQTDLSDRKQALAKCQGYCSEIWLLRWDNELRTIFRLWPMSWSWERTTLIRLKSILNSTALPHRGRNLKKISSWARECTYFRPR